MKLSAPAVLIAILLCACAPSTSPDPAAQANAAATPAASEAPDAAAGPPPLPAASAQTAPSAATDAAADATPAPASDDEQIVNDAIDANLGDHAKYESVIKQFQQAVAANDAAAVAGLVDYPISVDINGNDTVINDAETFVARYGEFMTPEISKAIVGTKYEDLFVNYKGVMFGEGQAWINGICKDEECNDFDVKVVTLQAGPG